MDPSVNDFEIVTKIGTGSFSKVYRVKRKTTGLEYALKKIELKSLSSKEKENSINEVRFLASLSNPFIISYKECIVDEAN